MEKSLPIKYPVLTQRSTRECKCGPRGQHLRYWLHRSAWADLHLGLFYVYVYFLYFREFFLF
jgi:hypothetical protein